jgi:hypothetical protein
MLARCERARGLRAIGIERIDLTDVVRDLGDAATTARILPWGDVQQGDIVPAYGGLSGVLAEADPDPGAPASFMAPCRLIDASPCRSAPALPWPGRGRKGAGVHAARC